MAYGWWLAYFDEPFINERPQVWQHGPVFKSLYHALSNYGWRDIYGVENDNPTSQPPRVPDSDLDVWSIISWTWDRYKFRSSEWLSEKTHEAGTPWETVVRSVGTKVDGGYEIPRNTYIPDDVIRDHYSELAQEFGFVDD